ncbi:hypothetical protein GALMADRAFT_131759 [Galerina marginata CBS 339.88]|uniref:DNA polymerase n=1 Tax=Galerina marginata (strain CBS 339.88) TaxID=685588 RepID=A0A067TYF1_GALM3|nr:hypothetical protein GALMADRAFT_131759 [Galerina marginata CBS 339.88]
MTDNAVSPVAGKKSAQLHVRINHIDHTLIPPGNLDNSTLPRVPVLRVFGRSSTGQTTCVHVHQVYPYFFVGYPGKLSPRHVKKHISKLFRSLNHAIALSLKRNPLSGKSNFIRAILLVKGIDFYGFHASYDPFLKILVADPAHVTRTVTILQSGSVMGTRFTVYESHLSYILQFLCDFGLYGCGLIELEEVFERCGEEPEETTTPTTNKFGVSSYFRESRLPLEVDVIAPHILNRHSLVARNMHHRLEIPTPFLSQEPLVLSVRELWQDERNHRRGLGLDPSPEVPIDPSESSRAGGGDWVAEARWWDEIRKRIGSNSAQEKPISTELKQTWELFVMTTFESVEAIWEKQYKTWKPSKEKAEIDAPEVDKSEQIPHLQDYVWDDITQEITDGKDEQIEVDISMLSNQDINRLDQEEADFLNKEELQEPPGAEENEDAEDSVYEDEQDSKDPANGDSERESSGPLYWRPSKFANQNGRLSTRKNFGSPPSPRLLGQDRIGSPTPTKLMRGHPGTHNVVTEEAEKTEEVENDDDTDERDLTPTRFNEYLPGSRKTEIRFATARDNPPEPLDVENDGDMDESDQTPTKSNKYLWSPKTKFATSRDDLPQLPDANQQDTMLSDIQEELSVTPAVLDAKERSSLIAARAVQLSKAFNTCKATSTNQYVYFLQPPTWLDLHLGLQNLGLSSKIYQTPYYSEDVDIPDNPKEYAGLTYHLKGGQGIASLDDWYTEPASDANQTVRNSPCLNPIGVGGWEYASHLPSMKEIRRTMELLEIRTNNKMKKQKLTSQIEGPTQANIYGFKTSPIADLSASRENANLAVMSVEIFVPTKDDKVPNAASDQVFAVFYAYHISGMEIIHTGILVARNSQIHEHRTRHIKFEIVETELDLLNRLVDLVVEHDPDILTGWELQLNSWGYLDARCNTYGLAFPDVISRAPPRHSGGSEIDQWGLRKTSTFKTAGRHVLNLWRIMRSEKTLTIYTFENVVFEVLGKRPVPAHAVLVVEHLLMRVITNLELLEATETITKTAEFARVFGVDFFSVLSRGSQFKVESFMFRIAKPESFVLISPSRNDVGKQNAAECMPLILEPASAFYSSPLLVLDFQSLYPSIMIAYNYCYSTCLGRITDFQGTYKFGVVNNLEISTELLEKLRSHITVAPNGIMYVKHDVRRGLLGRMLAELLDTRVMVKQAMKRADGDKARKRILDARQLSLKYIANVTYGYTSATFSGRMPAVEIADSIVQTGRETLEKAIDVIENTTKWDAKAWTCCDPVVYGDTDSVFVYLPGRTKRQAFAIGNEIADTITSLNPAPIKLKFEKVYLPCVLMAKKRYVGFKYESIDDTEPAFDAKGIETVRRDGVLAQPHDSNVFKGSRILFRTQNLSEVKDYCCRSWTKLLENKASVQDFIFAKEVKMGTYSDRGPPPPGVVVAARRMIFDPNNEAQYGDRIPYVIVRSTSGAPSQLQLDAHYYITRVLIPPLERIFNLAGADVRQWFNDMPKSIVPELVSPRKPKGVPASSPDRMNISEHFTGTQCLSCGGPSPEGLCDECCFSPQESIVNLELRIRTREERLTSTHRICSTCTGSTPSDPIHCESLDCQWFFARRKAEAGMELVPLFEELIEELETLPERDGIRTEEPEMDFYEAEDDL